MESCFTPHASALPLRASWNPSSPCRGPLVGTALLPEAAQGTFPIELLGQSIILLMLCPRGRAFSCRPVFLLGPVVQPRPRVVTWPFLRLYGHPPMQPANAALFSSLRAPVNFAGALSVPFFASNGCSPFFAGCARGVQALRSCKPGASSVTSCASRFMRLLLWGGAVPPPKTALSQPNSNQHTLRFSPALFSPFLFCPGR